MAILRIEQITNPASPARVRAMIYAIMGAVGTNTTSWKPGAVTRTIVAACAVILSSLSYLVAGIASSGFWQLASGDWLTICARYLAGVNRRTQTFAETTLTLTNSSGNVYNGNQVDDVTFANTAGKTFKNKAVFDLGAYGTATVRVVADVVGSSSTSPKNTITQILSPAMAGVTCTNALPAVGLDDESDPSVQRRCDDAAASRSPMGPREVFRRLSMFDENDNPLVRPDGVPVDVNRVHVNHSSLINTITVTVAGANGPVSGTWDDPSTDLGTVYANLIRWALPLGKVLVVQTVTTVGLDMSWSLVVDASINFTDAQLQTMAQSAVDNFLAVQEIGGYLVNGARFVFREGARSAIKGMDPKVLNVVSAGSDWTIGETQVPVQGVLTQGTVSRVQIS